MPAYFSRRSAEPNRNIASIKCFIVDNSVWKKKAMFKHSDRVNKSQLRFCSDTGKSFQHISHILYVTNTRAGTVASTPLKAFLCGVCMF